MKMKRKSFLTTAFMCLMALCLSLSAVTVIGSATAKAESADKTLTYKVSCFNAAGEAKGSLGVAPWDAMKAKGCKYAAVNIIFGADARYITVAFDEAVSAEEYASIDFGMNFYGGPTVTNNAKKAQIYKPALVDGKVSGTSRTETDVEVNAGWYIDQSNGQSGEMTVPVSNVSIPTDVLKQDDGLVYGFTIRCAAEASGGAHFAIMSDIVAKVKDVSGEEGPSDKEEETSEVSVIYDFDGTQVYGKYSNGAYDEKRRNIDLHYAADNNPAEVFAGDGTTQMAFTGGSGLAADGYVNIEFAKKIKAADFPRMVLRFCAGNWKGETITRLYKRADAEYTTVIEELETAYGNTCASWAIDTAKIADEDGYVRGFSLKRDDTAEGNKGQYFFDYVQFLIEADIPKYEVSNEYIEKDITEVMPVGNGFGFELKATKFAEETTEASVETKAFDVLDANVKVTYTNKYSFYFLVKATSAESRYNESGIMFWFVNDNITIGSMKDGKRNLTTVSASKKPEIVFESGKAVNVKLCAVPTYLEGVQTGYTLFVYMNGSEEAVASMYLDNGDISMGGYTNIVAQDLYKEGETNDFAVEIKTAGEAAHSASELMNVRIATSTGSTEYTKNRAIIKTSHFAVAGETVSDVKVEGDATYNTETGVLTFNSNGTVKLSYTVTNSFGTFESNVLELTYNDGTGSKDESANESTNESPNESVNNNGCGSGINAVWFAVPFFAAACVMFARKRKEND